MFKRWAVLFALVLLMAACSEEETEPAATQEEPETEEAAGPSQEELNEQMKEEATEIDFVEANGGDLSPGTKVKATGEISALDPTGLRGGDFMLSVEEGDGFGVYSVTNLNTVEIPLEEGQTVTVYGTFDGAEEGTSMPMITATIIE